MVIHQEIVKFLKIKNSFNSNTRDEWLNEKDNIMAKGIKLRTLYRGKQLVRMLTSLLENEKHAILMTQEFLYLSASIRNHTELKITSFIEDDDLDIYQISCIDKTEDVINFAINTLNDKFVFDKKIKLIIRNIKHQIKRYEVSKDTTIKEIKKVLNKKNKYDEENILLIFKGRKLFDHQTMSDIKLQDNDTIFVVYKVKIIKE